MNGIIWRTRQKAVVVNMIDIIIEKVKTKSFWGKNDKSIGFMLKEAAL